MRKKMHPPQIFQELWDDLQKRELLPIKIIYALSMAGAYSLFPFLTVHLRSLGVTATETALIYALLPVAAFLAPPIVGALVDKLGHVKVIFITTCVLNIIAGDFLLFVPPTMSNHPYPASLVWSLRCDESAVASSHSLRARLQNVDSPPCIVQSPHGANITFSIQQCWKRCDIGAVGNEVSSGVVSSRTCFGNHSQKTITCPSTTNVDDHLKFVSLRPATRTATDTVFEGGETDFDFAAVEVNGFTYDGCVDDDAEDRSQCRTSCSGLLVGTELCRGSDKYNGATFWMYLVIRMVWTLLTSSTYVLFEAITLEVTKVHDADYGHQKLLGAVAMCVSSPLTGVLIDQTSVGRKRPNYDVAFYVYSACGVLTIIAVSFFDMTFKMPTQTLCKDLKILLSNADFNIFIMMMFLMGSFWGYLEGFLFWFLQEMEATESLMGLTVTVGALSGIPMLIYAGTFLNKFGHVNVFILAFFLYAVRFFGYSIIWNPYLCLLFETLEAFTNSLQSVAAATFTAKLAPTSILASAQGIMTGMQYGIGKGVGSLVGGYLMASIGSRACFRVMSIASTVAGFVYIIIFLTFLKKRQRKLKIELANKDIKEESIIRNGFRERRGDGSQRENGTRHVTADLHHEQQSPKKTVTFNNGTPNSGFEPDLLSKD